MKKLWLNKGHPVFALFVVLIFGSALLIASSTATAITAAPMINDQINTLDTIQDTTVGPGPCLAITQSTNTIISHEVIGLGQKSDVLGTDKNTFFEKDDLSLQALPSVGSDLGNDTAIEAAGSWGYHPIAG